ncbi:MAG: hypothetical protein QXU45_03690 [Candidatus Bathyarchaeia archaeon]
MKNVRKTILALGLALLLAVPALVILSPRANADDSVGNISSLPVKGGPWNTIWYKFETPLITLIFPAGGKKPMFLWWYTNDSSKIYVVKFQGVIEYLMLELDKPYYRHRFHADNATINATLWSSYIEPKLYQRQYQYGYGWYSNAVKRFLGLLLDLHRAYLPFSACNWTLSGPVYVEDKDYWSFNFTLTDVYGHPRLEFAENNIEIRCRFYNKTVTEIPDEAYEDYNYTVAAGQLKFDFVVKHWEWNIDKINKFLKDYGIDKEIPESRTGLALWIKMASITLEDLPCAENEVRYEAEHHVEAEAQLRIESKSRMREAAINGEYYAVDKNETSQDEKPVQATLQLRERFRERIRLHFAVGKTDVPVGFLEFVPWARLLNETGGTVDFVNVTASYVAAGGHLRLFICYPYFGNYTLEHDPTIGLTSAPVIPELINPKLLLVLIGATAVIVVLVAAVKIRKKPVNILAVK